jgi:hypothetical protein
MHFLEISLVFDPTQIDVICNHLLTKLNDFKNIFAKIYLKMHTIFLFIFVIKVLELMKFSILKKN